jgi:spoIIIJ-associated protein
MIGENEIQIIKDAIKTFFEKTTIQLISTEVLVADNQEDGREVVSVEVELQEPQILIGQGGQTLFEIQRLLKIVLNKKTGKMFYLDFDINGYKKKKNEYLKRIADDVANEVAFTKLEKVLSPMPAYERRVIHAELAKREDVKTESAGDGENRHIIIKPV